MVTRLLIHLDTLITIKINYCWVFVHAWLVHTIGYTILIRFMHYFVSHKCMHMHSVYYTIPDSPTLWQCTTTIDYKIIVVTNAIWLAEDSCRYLNVTLIAARFWYNIKFPWFRTPKGPSKPVFEYYLYHSVQSLHDLHFMFIHLSLRMDVASVECRGLSIGYITRCRSLGYLHTEGPRLYKSSLISRCSSDPSSTWDWDLAVQNLNWVQHGEQYM